MRYLAYRAVHRVASVLLPMNHYPKLRLVFLHVPKCGGTSIEHAIRKSVCYFDGKIRADAELYALRLRTENVELNHPQFWVNSNDTVAKLMFANVPIISGHFSMTPELLHANEEYQWVTVLRRPEERWFSHFRYWMKIADPVRNQEILSQISEPGLSEIGQLEKFLETDLAGFFGRLTSVCLGGYQGEDLNSEVAMSQLKERAKVNLKKIAVIGFIDQPEVFAKNVQERFGLPPFDIPVMNTTQGLKSNPVVQRSQLTGLANVPEELLQKIRDLCQHDVEIYENAKQQC